MVTALFTDHFLLTTDHSINMENKSSNSSRNGNGIVTTLLLGLAAGAVLGVLFAPDKGSNTRARLTFKLASYKDQLMELLEELQIRKESTLESDAVAESKIAVEKLVVEIESLIEKIQSGKA